MFFILLFNSKVLYVVMDYGCCKFYDKAWKVIIKYFNEEKRNYEADLWLIVHEEAELET